MENNPSVFDMVAHLGMSAIADGSLESVHSETCILIALGTDHEDQFVREIWYAVGLDGAVYKYDPVADDWYSAGNEMTIPRESFTARQSPY